MRSVGAEEECRSSWTSGVNHEQMWQTYHTCGPAASISLSLRRVFRHFYVVRQIALATYAAICALAASFKLICDWERIGFRLGRVGVPGGESRWLAARDGLDGGPSFSERLNISLGRLAMDAIVGSRV
jgi:hypothetical protein